MSLPPDSPPHVALPCTHHRCTALVWALSSHYADDTLGNDALSNITMYPVRTTVRTHTNLSLNLHCSIQVRNEFNVGCNTPNPLSHSHCRDKQLHCHSHCHTVIACTAPHSQLSYKAGKAATEQSTLWQCTLTTSMAMHIHQAQARANRSSPQWLITSNACIG